jgi:hypothetical protein
MKIYFEDEKDTYAFLDLCKIIAKVMEESEKFKARNSKLLNFIIK